MDEGTIKTQDPKCRLHWCLIEFIDWRYSQSCWYFRPLFVNCCPSTFSLASPNPSLLPKVTYSIFRQCVAVGGGEGGGGVLSCVVDHILQEFNILFVTRFRTYKIATPPKQKWPVKTNVRLGIGVFKVPSSMSLNIVAPDVEILSMALGDIVVCESWTPALSSSTCPSGAWWCCTPRCSGSSRAAWWRNPWQK
jgi:hypothetical protein